MRTPPPPEPTPTPSAMRRALRRAADGVTLDADEAAVLLAARGDDLAALSDAAGRVRDAGLLAAGRPGVVTYSRKVFIPLTRLCRDRCHYCTFATTPAHVPAPFLERDEVLAIAREGAALSCKEALFTLGDRPEERWPAAREWLAARGYATTAEYLRACAIAVLEDTGLLPHLNPGVLTWEELVRLKPVAPSMGMMLETTATRLWSEPGAVHYGSPDKEPALRLRVLQDAGRVGVPFTTGLLLGIGETRRERAETVLAIRQAARAFGGVQEVIVQNFRAKDDTAMSRWPDVGAEELAAAVAVTRLLLGPSARVQAPPNLIDLAETRLLLAAGIDDWGGVSPLTPDHVNPERPWPHLDALAAATAAGGFTLRERLTVHPPYVLAGEPWIDPRVLPHVRALADPVTGLAREGVAPVGRPWQEPDGAWGDAGSGRVDLATSIDVEGRRTATRSDLGTAFGSWAQVADDAALAATASGEPGVRDGRDHGTAAASGAPERLDAEVRAALARAADDPAGLTDAEALALLGADGPALEALAGIADDVRRDAVGDVVTYVVNRNINFTNVCYVGCRFCAFAQRRGDADAFTLSLDEVADRAAQAWAVGATEVCMQGGISPDLRADTYVALVRAIKTAVPDMHVHAFSPMEIVTGAARAGLSIEDFLVSLREAGLDSIPGTAAEILDDEVRWVLTKGKLPTATWVDVVSTAHRVGLRSSATMMYGHVDAPRHWVAHLRVLTRIQDDTGGFTEFVPLPFVHASSPVYLAGIARPGPTRRENRAVHAVSRLLLHGRIANVQCSWVKLGEDGCAEVLRGGVNDLGGTLMEETISRMAGSEHGSVRSVAELAAMGAAVGREVRQRTTLYGEVPDERRAAAQRLQPRLAAVSVGAPVGAPSGGVAALPKGVAALG